MTAVPNPWPNCNKLPPGAAAALAALHLAEPRVEALGRLTEPEWREALDFCDRSRLTLALRSRAFGALPPWVRERLDRDAAGNLERLARTEETYRELASRLAAAGAEFVALKGLTHSALFGGRPEERVQYDIDLFLPPGGIYAARDALLAAGYESAEDMERFPTDHLPVLVRKTAWSWRGDFFDVDIPLSVELHFQFWNDRLERLPAPGVGRFWDRRATRRIAGIEIGVLHPADALGYAALHALRHLLRGSVSPFHVYEIASLLQARAEDAAWWSEWRALHHPGLRRLEAVIFRLAAEWFGCRLHPIAAEAIEELPADSQDWFARFATAPATSPFHPNKEELWLHLSLLDSRADAWSVARRRLLPLNRPAAGGAAYARSRLRHHALALPRAALSGARWWWHTKRLGEQFWIFLGAAVLFNFALFIFVLLYNLFLLDLGFREDFLGIINGASRVGSVAGTLPAAYLARRFGMRNTLLATFAATAVIEVFRAVIGARLPLAGLAFLSGAIFSVWAVLLTPMIAGAVSEKLRPTAFSVFFATMFATGIVGNWLGGRLPLWLHGKQTVLLVSAALTALAVLPALRLRAPPRPARERARVYPRSGFLLRFLIPFAIWQLATCAFNPFNNVYFARLGFSVERIGNVFSGSQLVQVATVLLAPWVIRRAGLLNGIVGMMAATALGLGGLGAQPPGGAAVLVYAAYMSFQWMSEPGMNTLLMNRVAEDERGGASALTYLVGFSAQALAAFGAGQLLARFGYGVVLAGAAALAVTSAGLLRALLADPKTVRQPPALPVVAAGSAPE